MTLVVSTTASRGVRSLAPAIEEVEVNLLGAIVSLVTRMLDRRRVRWVEISVERAWSHDLLASSTLSTFTPDHS